MSGNTSTTKKKSAASSSEAKKTGASTKKKKPLASKTTKKQPAVEQQQQDDDQTTTDTEASTVVIDAPASVATGSVRDLSSGDSDSTRRVKFAEQEAPKRGPVARSKSDSAASPSNQHQQQQTKNLKRKPKRKPSLQEHLAKGQQPQQDAETASSSSSHACLALLVENLFPLKKGHTSKQMETMIDMMIRMELDQDDNEQARDELLLHTNICQHLVKGMQKYLKTATNNVNLQWKCCQLIIGLTVNHVPFANALLRHGAATAVVAAMRQHAEHAQLQAYGCSALGNLALGQAARVVQAQGISAVLQAMQAYPQDLVIQRNAVLALCNVSCTQEAALVQAGVVQQLVELLQTYPNELPLQQYSCAVFQNLSYSQAAAFCEGGDDSGLTAMLQVMERYPNDDMVQEYASGALSNLTLMSTPATAVAVAAAGKAATTFDRPVREPQGDFNQLIIERGGGVLLAQTHQHFQGRNSRVVEKTRKAIARLHQIS